MIKQEILTYNQLLECNGIDYEYNILHTLNSKILFIQLIHIASGTTVGYDKYSCIRDNENSITIKFKMPPINGEKYHVLIIRCE